MKHEELAPWLKQGRKEVHYMGASVIPTPPGHTIREQMKEKNVTFEELRDALHAHDNKDMENYLSGKYEIDESEAKSLQALFGLPADFWLALESYFRLNLYQFWADMRAVEEDISMKSINEGFGSIRRDYVKGKKTGKEYAVDTALLPTGGYETIVFPAKYGALENFDELDCIRCGTEAQALRNHEAMMKKWEEE